MSGIHIFVIYDVCDSFTHRVPAVWANEFPTASYEETILNGFEKVVYDLSPAHHPRTDTSGVCVYVPH